MIFNMFIYDIIDEMYGCIDPSACNYDIGSVYDDGSCLYNDDCNLCDEAANQLDCMAIECMWMGDHCMQSNDMCSDYENQLDCMNDDSCYWMGDHFMTGSNCTDPIALSHNPIADLLDLSNNNECEYSHLLIGCTYENSLNYDIGADVDDGSCMSLMEI